MTGRVFVDTNIWVYAVDTADRRKRSRAMEVLEASMHDGVVVSPQVLGEYYVTVTRKLTVPLTHDAAVADVRVMLRQTVVPVDGRLVEAATAGVQVWQLSYWDALIVAAARTAGASTILTEDLQHGRTIEGVRIVDPFRDA